MCTPGLSKHGKAESKTRGTWFRHSIHTAGAEEYTGAYSVDIILTLLFTSTMDFIVLDLVRACKHYHEGECLHLLSVF